MISISVCLATFDGEPFVQEQVASVLPQLGPEDEFVISDNGSSDGTLAFLQAIGDARVRVVVFTEARGPVANFENAIRLATREVIVLCDQDDVWFPDRLERVRRAFSDIRPPPMCLVSDGTRIDAQGQTIAQSNLGALRFRTGFWGNLAKNSFMGCTMAFRRELLRIALPFPRGIPMHDSWLGILAGWQGTIVVDPNPTYGYRVHGRNLSHRPRAFRAKIWDRVALGSALLARMVRSCSRGGTPGPPVEGSR
ncbi:MAG: glycosyltransferase [Anaeromyxobacteraceae bacterium]